MKISVITPTRNRATTYIADLICSLENQSMPRDCQLEHIICDDASEKSELLYLQKLCHATSVPTCIIKHNQQQGVAAARNTALLHASGDFIIDVDDDDYLPFDSIQNRVLALRDSGALWSFGNAYVVNEQKNFLRDEHLIQNWLHNVDSQTEALEKLLSGRAWYWSGTRTYRREALWDADRPRLWNTQYIVAEDYDHWLRLTAEIGPPLHHDDFVVCWRKKNNSLGIDSVRSGLMEKAVSEIRTKWQARLQSLTLAS